MIQRHTPEETAEKFQITSDEVKIILSESKEKLAKYRFEKRPKPHRDDKILTSWNGIYTFLIFYNYIYIYIYIF